MPNEDIYCVLLIGAPCLTQAAWAAWVQAVGTLIAVGVAILVPLSLQRSTSRIRERDRKAKQKSMALAVLEDLSSIEREIRIYFDQYYDPAEPDNHLESAEFEKLASVPITLNTLAPRLHELGEASDSVLNVVAALISARDQLGEWNHNRFAVGHPYDVEETVIASLKSARTLAKRAIAELLALFPPR